MRGQPTVTAPSSSGWAFRYAVVAGVDLERLGAELLFFFPLPPACFWLNSFFDSPSGLGHSFYSSPSLYVVCTGTDFLSDDRLLFLPARELGHGRSHIRSLLNHHDGSPYESTATPFSVSPRCRSGLAPVIPYVADHRTFSTVAVTSGGATFARDIFATGLTHALGKRIGT